MKILNDTKQSVGITKVRLFGDGKFKPIDDSITGYFHDSTNKLFFRFVSEMCMWELFAIFQDYLTKFLWDDLQYLTKPSLQKKKIFPFNFGKC